MSFLFFLVYAAAAGGLLPLLESSPGSAQELKVKVSLAEFTQKRNNNNKKFLNAKRYSHVSHNVFTEEF